MKKKHPAKQSAKKTVLIKPDSVSIENSFAEVLQLIQSARLRAYQAVNSELVSLYWQVGEYISRKVASENWGTGAVSRLSSFIQKAQPAIRGFSPQNLWRMRQFYEAYRNAKILSPLVRELPWTHHLMILAHAKREEEREFYIRLAIRERWGKRELERQLNNARFERTLLTPPKLAPLVRELHPEAANIFKDTYALEFLGISDNHTEADLHRSLLQNLGRFLTELGRDFCYVGSEYPIQVGGQDFSLDLLFFHRGLNCLVAVELKATRFEPEHLGKLNFYLEALDRNSRKPHENPALGLLLCATKDSEVVEYALSRSLSPAMIAEYETKLPPKKLLEEKLHEFYQMLAPVEEPEARGQKRVTARRKTKPARNARK